MMKFSSQIAWTVHQTGQTVWCTIDTIDLTQQGCVTDVLCCWVSQTYMSYSSMSEYICGREWVVLFITQNRRMTADKWIRSVTVTVASAALIHRTCVCVRACASRPGSEWSLCTSWCCVDLWHHIHGHMYTHFFVLAYPVSANTTLIFIFALFFILWNLNKQICVKLICIGVLTSSLSVTISKHWPWWYFWLA